MSAPITRAAGAGGPPRVTPGCRGLRRPVGAVLATAALAAGPIAPATAQEARPAPTTCAGIAFTDPAGDATAVAARENLDLTAGFLRYAPNSSGGNVLTANIQVTDLHKTMEAGSYYTSWTFRWTSGSSRQYVGLSLLRDGRMAFTYGTYADTSSTILGETTGRMLLGKDGIVEIVVPVAKLGLEGKRLVSPHALAGFTNADGLNTYPEVVVDSAPDSRTGGKAFDVVPCAAEQTPTTPQPATPPGQPAGVGPARLNVKVIAGRQSARRITKRRTLSIRLRAGERTTALRLRLMRGRRVVAAGSLASLSGPGAVTLRLTSKTSKLRPGTYTLRLTGRTASGRVADGQVQVRIRR